jgi:hypothetical protein
MAKAQPFRLEATYTPISKRSCSRSYEKARSMTKEAAREKIEYKA